MKGIWESASHHKWGAKWSQKWKFISFDTLRHYLGLDFKLWLIVLAHSKISLLTRLDSHDNWFNNMQSMMFCHIMNSDYNSYLPCETSSCDKRPMQCPAWPTHRIIPMLCSILVLGFPRIESFWRPLTRANLIVSGLGALIASNPREKV